MPRIAVALLALLSVSAAALGQVSSGATPVFHGVLDVLPSGGKFNPETGSASLNVRSWRFLLTTRTNGIFPAEEPVIVAIGENTYMLPPGALRASRSGKSFTFTAPRGDTQPIRKLRLKLRRDGSYAVRFALNGVDLSKLVLEDPVCLPTALLVGDDDGFACVQYTRRNFRSRRLRIPQLCDQAACNVWPWT